MLNEPNLITQRLKRKGAKGETISELAHRHLLDEKHTTTDEELANAEFEFSENLEESERNLTEMKSAALIYRHS